MGGLFSRNRNTAPSTSTVPSRTNPTHNSYNERPTTTTRYVAPAPFKCEEPRVVISYTPVYALSVTGRRVGVFIPSQDDFIAAQISNIKEGEIYFVNSISPHRLSDFTTPTDSTRRTFLERDSLNIVDVAAYRKWILPALLLGCRVRDFEQRCATVSQLGPLVLSMPAQDRRKESLQLKTVSGVLFVVYIERVWRDSENRRWTVTCFDQEEDDDPIPVEVRQGSQLEIVEGGSVQQRQPQVTAALLQFYSGSTAAAASPIDNWPLLGAIYGPRGTGVYPAAPAVNGSIRMSNGAWQKLNPEQAEAVALYNCASCPAFVVEAPPGSGKTVTAAAMAVSYRGQGVQLFLSTANVPVVNMALALAKLDYGHLSPIHLISAEFEEKCSEETRSPFSPLALAMQDEEMREEIEDIMDELALATKQEDKDALMQELQEIRWSMLDQPHDVYFATIDTILARILKQNKGGNYHVDVVKKLLQTKVEKVVVDEASQLTEAALNALILSFPKAQIVLIGDSKQLPPFKYKSGVVVSELAARPSLDVVKAKNNLPVIKLRRVYRASPSLIAHYSDVFYESSLVSCKQEAKNPLSCFGARSGGSRCLFWRVKKGHSKTPANSTSKINIGELRALQYIINILRNSRYDEKDIMIISYYEAQRRKAEEDLPGFEVLTVDSAQGREKRIVIVLTTRSSVPADTDEDFFSSAKRCNVAVSRHQEALIVIGHPAIEAAPNWGPVLSKEYFKHVDNDDTGSEVRRSRRRR